MSNVGVNAAFCGHLGNVHYPPSGDSLLPTPCGHSVRVGESVDEKGRCDFCRPPEADCLSSVTDSRVGCNITLVMLAGWDRRNSFNDFYVVPN